MLALAMTRDQRFQPLALGLVLDARRHADDLGLRQQHEITRWNADLSRQTRALAADRILHHLDHDLLTVAQQFGDRRHRGHGRGGCRGRRRKPAIAVAIQRGFDRVPKCAFADGRDAGTENVVGMQESRAVQADIDERRLHAGHHPLHLAFVDIADHTAAPAALDVQFLQHPVFDHRDPRFARGDVDQNLFAHDVGAPAMLPRAAGNNPNCRSSCVVSCSGNPITPL